MSVPRGLRIWFLVHFVIDYLFAIPLFLFPVATLSLLGFVMIDPLATRIVAAALFAIGGISILVREASSETYRHILTLKIIWSLFATIACIVAVIKNAFIFGAWAGLFLFLSFGILWVYYRLKLNRGVIL